MSWQLILFVATMAFIAGVLLYLSMELAISGHRRVMQWFERRHHNKVMGQHLND